MQNDRNKLFFSPHESPKSYANRLGVSKYLSDEKKRIIDTIDTQSVIPLEKYLANLDMCMYIAMKNQYPQEEFVTLELNRKKQIHESNNPKIEMQDIDIDLIKISRKGKKIYKSSYHGYNIIRAAIDGLKYIDQANQFAITHDNLSEGVTRITNEMINLFGTLSGAEIITLLGQKYDLSKGGKISFIETGNINEIIEIISEKGLILLKGDNNKTIASIQEL